MTDDKPSRSEIRYMQQMIRYMQQIRGEGPDDESTERCGGTGKIGVGLAISNRRIVPCPGCEDCSPRSETARERAASALLCDGCGTRNSTMRGLCHQCGGENLTRYVREPFAPPPPDADHEAMQVLDDSLATGQPPPDAAEGEERWTIRVCKHGEVVTFPGGTSKPLHLWEPGGGDCDDTPTFVRWVEVVPLARSEQARREAEEGRDTPDAAGGEEGYEQVSNINWPPEAMEGLSWRVIRGESGPRTHRLTGVEVVGLRGPSLDGIETVVPLARATAAEEARREWQTEAARASRRVIEEQDLADRVESQLAHYKAEVERLAHGICDALDPDKPTEPILRALIRGTDHEGHRLNKGDSDA